MHSLIQSVLQSRMDDTRTDVYSDFNEFDGSREFIDFLTDVNAAIRYYGLDSIDLRNVLANGYPEDPEKVKKRLREGLTMLGQAGQPDELQRQFRSLVAEVIAYPKTKSKVQLQREEEARRAKREAEEQARRNREAEELERQRRREEQRHAQEEAHRLAEQLSREEEAQKKRQMRAAALQAAEARLKATTSKPPQGASDIAAKGAHVTYKPTKDQEMRSKWREEKEKNDLHREESEKSQREEAVSPKSNAEDKVKAEFACVLAALVRKYRLEDPAGLVRCLQTLSIYIGNSARNPSDAKFQHINCQNKGFLSRVAAFQGAVDVLKACGFVDAGAQVVYTADAGKASGISLWEAQSKIDIMVEQIPTK